MAEPRIPAHLLFIDLETGGLGEVDAAERAIVFQAPLLSIAARLVAPDGEVLFDTGDLLIDEWARLRAMAQEDPDAFAALPAARRAMHPAAEAMHEESGLLAALTDPRQMLYCAAEAQDHILGLLERHLPAGARLLLAGKSSGSLDRPMLQIHMPALAARLGHRSLDASSVVELFALAGIDLDAQVKADGAVYTHVASDDNDYAHRLVAAALGRIGRVDPALIRSTPAVSEEQA